eukprot:scaffold267007_cov26-Tisochrysis_lutea.AAC.1
MLTIEAASDLAAATTAAEEAADGAAARLVVQVCDLEPAWRKREGLEALLPLAALVDADKERARLGKQQVRQNGSTRARTSSLGSYGKSISALHY